MIVTHNMQQAARIADRTAFFSVETGHDGHRSGILVEYDSTSTIFTNARRSPHRGLRDGPVRLMRTEFQSELDRLESLLAGGRRPGRPGAARHAWRRCKTQDAGLADHVIAFDDQVDDALPGHRRGVELLLARQAPVATDLRLALSMLHINLHLERMADQCVNIAKMLETMRARSACPTSWSSSSTGWARGPSR